MQPLFDTSVFAQASSRTLFDLCCVFCHKTFCRPKHDIQKVIAQNQSLTLDFCSTKCFSASIDTRTIIPCKTCNKPVVKSQKEVRDSKSGNTFCSQSCAAKWNNAHKTKGTRVSKLEVWLSNQLPVLYPDLEFHFNRTDAINGELDIFVPSLKLAFELNGIFHYEPIYGPDKLASIQSNDGRKFQACLERGIELCTVDVSSLKHFKEHNAQKFLSVIASVIDQKRPLTS